MDRPGGCSIGLGEHFCQIHKRLYFLMLSYLMTLMISRMQLIKLTVSTRSKWKVENPRFPSVGAEVNVLHMYLRKLF